MTNSFKQVVDQAGREDRVYLMEHEVKAILEGQDISTTRSLVARSEDEAVNLFRSIRSPVALKILSPDVIHKSDTGGVKLNLRNEDQVREAYRQIINSFRDKTVTGISVQEMAKPGVEVIIGVTLDPTFGPVMMFGLGGVFVEILKDVSFRSIPLSEYDAEDMIEEIKGYALLKGYRGSAADVPALRDLLLKVSDLVMENPEIKEMDLNPVFIYPQGYKVVDARIILGEPRVKASRALPKQDLHDLF